jgi:hypothetical protein
VVIATLACLLVGGASAGTLFASGDAPPPAADAGIDPTALAERAVRHDPVCEPAGCVAWRSPLDDEVAAAGHGLVLLLGDRSVRALDGASGAPRWSADVTDLTSGRGSSGRGSPSLGRAALVPAEEGVLVVTPGALASFTRDGARAWTHRLTGFVARDAAVQGDRVVVRTRSPRGAGPFGRVSVLDLADGTERWGREVAAIHPDAAIPDPLPRHLGASQVPDDAPVLVTGPDRTLEALDVDDGELVWSTPLGDPPAQVRRRGGVVTLADATGRRDLTLRDGGPHRTGESFPPRGSAGARHDGAWEVALADGTVLGEHDGRSRPLARDEGRVHLLDEELVLVGTDPVVVADPDRVVGVRLRTGG